MWFWEGLDGVYGRESCGEGMGRGSFLFLFYLELLGYFVIGFAVGLGIIDVGGGS